MNSNFFLTSLIAIFLLTGLFSCSKKEFSNTEQPEESVQINKDAELGSVSQKIDSQQTQKPEVSDELQPASDDNDKTEKNPKASKIVRYKPVSKEENWFFIGAVAGYSPYKVFVDTESIQGENGIVESLSKLLFETTQTDEDGLSYNEVKINSSVDCVNMMYSYTDSRFFDGLGRMVESQQAPYNPQPIIEGTVSAKIADFVCGYDSNRPKE